MRELRAQAKVAYNANLEPAPKAQAQAQALTPTPQSQPQPHPPGGCWAVALDKLGLFMKEEEAVAALDAKTLEFRRGDYGPSFRDDQVATPSWARRVRRHPTPQPEQHTPHPTDTQQPVRHHTSTTRAPRTEQHTHQNSTRTAPFAARLREDCCSLPAHGGGLMREMFLAHWVAGQRASPRPTDTDRVQAVRVSCWKCGSQLTMFSGTRCLRSMTLLGINAHITTPHRHRHPTDTQQPVQHQTPLTARDERCAAPSVPRRDVAHRRSQGGRPQELQLQDLS